MTLILAMGNQRHVVLVSDRRISRGGQVVSLVDEPEGDESNKAFILRLKNARLAFAFTGLASDGKRFLAKRWLPGALMDAAAPDSLMVPTIERFAMRATQDFKSLSIAPPLDKRMSIFFAGYCNDDAPPRCFYWLVSNYERLAGLCRETEATEKPADEFFVTSIRDKRPTAKGFASLIAAGADHAVSEENGTLLYEMVQQDKPADALVGKAVDMVRQAAKSLRSANTVGNQCSSIVLPSDFNHDVTAQYHSAKSVSRAYYPTVIQAVGDGSGVYAIAEPMIEARDVQGRPLIPSFRKVGANQPCPCGSGKKYKKCCRRLRR